MDSTEIVVIGGGAAGIAAASHLHQAGRACVLLDARDRLGGRGWTINAGGQTIDLGCGWLHSADRNPWTKIAQTQGREIDRSLAPWQRPATGFDMTQAEFKMYRHALGDFYARLSDAARHQPDRPASELLDSGGRWNALIRSVIGYISGADVERLSVRDFENYEDNEVNWRVVEGYGTTIVAHADGVEVILNCPVTRIDHGGKRLRIETAQGSVEAEKAIVTLPTDVIAGMHDLFSPALPEKIDAAAGLPLGLADKLFLSLAHAEEFEPDTRVFGRTDAVTGTYSLRSFGRPLIECYFGAGLAADLERGGEKAFVAHAVHELTARMGSAFAKRLDFLALHCWRADPFAGGSYSFALPGQEGKRTVLAAPVDGRLFFAGEACSVHDFSTAHGAYRTGITAAKAVLDS